MEKYSLKPVLPVLEKLLGKKVLFADDCLGESAVNMSAALKPGEIFYLKMSVFILKRKGSLFFLRQLQMRRRKLPKQK